MLFVHRIELYRKLQMTNKWRHFYIKKKKFNKNELIYFLLKNFLFYWWHVTLCAKNITLLRNNLRMQESDASQGSRSQGNISAKKKRGDGCQKLNKFQKKIPHQGKKNPVDFGPIC